MKVKAIASFEHGSTRRRGDEFEVSDKIGEQLVKKRLAVIVDGTGKPGEPDATEIKPVAKQPARKPATAKE